MNKHVTQRCNKKLNYKLFASMSLSLALSLSSISIANAESIDDLRELAGKKRMDSIYSADEQSKIMVEYAKIEEHNRVARMFEASRDIDVSSEAEKRWVSLKKDIEKQRTLLKETFSSGKSVDEVMVVKSKLETLIHEQSQLKEVGEQLDMKVIPNKWEAKYKKLMAMQTEIKNNSDIGVVGSAMESPVRGSFQLSSPYGKRWSPVTEKYYKNKGLGIQGEQGQEVLSQWNGKVASVKKVKNKGYSVKVTNGDGLTTTYSRLKKVKVKAGKKVKQYDVLGSLGKVNKKDSPHLLLEVTLDGKHVNPILFFGERGRNALKTYFSATDDEDYEDITSLLRKIKDRPKRLDLETKKKEESKRVKTGEKDADYTKTGEVPEDSIQLVIPKSFEAPNPVGEIK